VANRSTPQRSVSRQFLTGELSASLIPPLTALVATTWPPLGTGGPASAYPDSGPRLQVTLSAAGVPSYHFDLQRAAGLRPRSRSPAAAAVHEAEAFVNVTPWHSLPVSLAISGNLGIGHPKHLWVIRKIYNGQLPSLSPCRIRLRPPLGTLTMTDTPHAASSDASGGIDDITIPDTPSSLDVIDAPVGLSDPQYSARKRKMLDVGNRLRAIG